MGHYFTFVVFATTIAVAPGPDTFLTLRNTVRGGRSHGLWTTLGICTAGAVQGVLAAAGLGAVIAASRPIFDTIRWAGVAYLVWLAIGALRSAAAPDGGAQWSDGSSAALPRSATRPVKALRQGFLCNITNPKVLAFNLAVLPQFVGSGASVVTLLAYALTLTFVGALVLLGVVAAATKARALLARRRTQRLLEGATGVIMLGFAGALAVDA